MLSARLARTLALPAAAILLAAAAPAPAAADLLFTATLDGPAAGTGSPAVGTAELVLNDARTEIAYDIRYENLQGTETGAHFHYGEPGAFGPRLLTLPLGTPKIGVWEVDAFDLEQLEAGLVYINVHTDLYASGEIRGDVSFAAVPDETPSWSGVKALYR